MNKEQLQQLISAYMQIAFEAGRWQGQVDLEISMDNNLGDALQGALYAQKTGMPLHTVSSSEDGCPVRYMLRSADWREGVTKSSIDALNKATDALTAEVSA